MRLGRILRHRLHSLFQRSRTEAELQREIDLHIEQLVKERLVEGMSESEARLSALREFGPQEATKEQCRDMRRVNLTEDLGKDLVYACRLLRKSPGFTLTAVLSLALGIGANTIVFSVLNALLLRPLPVADPDRIYLVERNGSQGHSFPNYRDIRDRDQVFESLFSARITQLALGDGRGAQRVWGYLVTGNYFETLGIQPALGRFFTPAEDLHPNASPYAVLSYACWRNRFGGDPDLVGRDIRINGRPYTVLGVAPRGFQGTEVFYSAEIWVPMMMQPHIEFYSWLETRNTFNTWIGGRLNRGVTVDQAEAHLHSIAAQMAREHTVNEGMRLTLAPPGLAGSLLRGPTRAFGGAVMLLASLLLLAACSNLAALLLARTGDRERELAMRVSIGAGPGRLVRQFLTESLFLSALGGAAGLSLAAILLGMLSQWRAPLDFPVQLDVSVDWRVFLFALAVAIAGGLLFGFAPARRAWKADPALSLKGMAAPVSTRLWSTRDVLLPLQIAICCVLVIASLVAVRGLMRAVQAPLGIAPDGCSVVGFDAGLSGYDEERGRRFHERALAEVVRLPGIESAAYSSSVPLSIDQSTTTVYREKTTEFRPKNAFKASYYYVSPGYFRTVGTRLLSGRDFTPRDDRERPAVAIVNQTFARRIVGTEAAVGRTFLRGGNNVVQIVGVVEDGKYQSLTETAHAAVFLPIHQNYSPTIVVLARSRLPEAEIAAEMRRLIAGLDPQLAVYGVGSVRQMLGLVYLPMHAVAIALGAFGVLALMIAITGIYGLSAYLVSRRTREIAIRVAVGANAAQVLRSLFGRTATLVTAGALLGLALGIAGAGVLTAIVYQASLRDPFVIGSAVMSISLAAFAAAFGPARRALRIYPADSLRHE